MLGIPLKQRAGAPSTPINLPRKLVRPLPALPAAGYAPEPGISEEDYKHILAVIRHESRTYETTPGTFANLGEEDIRNILLAHLNSHYEGMATGETFRGSGKTDIRIEDSSRSAFVAECKVWKGSGELTKAINQLLGYLTWRDCKTALVVFNKHNARFSGILSQVEEIFQSHECFKHSLMEHSKENGNSVWHRFETPAGLCGSMSSSSTYTIQEPSNIKVQRTGNVMYDEQIEPLSAADLERRRAYHT